jgi:hypothetical protein
VLHCALKGQRQLLSVNEKHGALIILVRPPAAPLQLEAWVWGQDAADGARPAAEQVVCAHSRGPLYDSQAHHIMQGAGEGYEGPASEDSAPAQLLLQAAQSVGGRVVVQGGEEGQQVGGH